MSTTYIISDFCYKVVGGGKLQLIDCIGHGSFGAVFRAREVAHPESSLLAVKIIPKDEQSQLYRRELLLHGVVQAHPGVASIRDTFSDKHFLYIVLDYFAAGDVWRAIKEKKVFWGNDALVRSIFLQMIDAVAFCHEKGVYHRDLKPNNFLISHDMKQVRLTDFGLASMTRKNHAYGVGTHQYRSPECNNILGDHQGFDAVRNDIWALGIILVNMLAGGVMPWAVASADDGWYQAFIAAPDFLRYTLPVSREAAHILQRMLTEREADCVSLAELRVLVACADRFFMSDAEIAAGAPHLHRVARNCRPAPPAPKTRRPAFVHIPSAHPSWGSGSSWARSPSILEETRDIPLACRATPEPPMSDFVNSEALPSVAPDVHPCPGRAEEKPLPSEESLHWGPCCEEPAAAKPPAPKRGNTYEGGRGVHKFGVRQKLRRLFTLQA
ncbi:serine/threonine protein kinase-like protein [Phanerochaete sordida]|uniref:Serine/threonine protein kinase-like protein n=1 Tax=Phanerochaete sordida TaxID=48140 RepID=A0A9P3G2G1_9APHY|nr:serine/threonine protein kinase-like protein [Phanerochaete sordida]